MKLFTVAQMQSAERAADAAGHSYAAMMERAGRAVADAVAERYPLAGQNVLVLVGPGNNGGDGLVAGHYLAERGADVVFYLTHPRDVDNDENYARIMQAGLFTLQQRHDQRFRVLRTRLNVTHIVVDALLGTGVARPISGDLARLLQQVQAGLDERNAILAATPPQPLTSLTDATPVTPAPRVRVVAVDCPSGLNCDSGALDPLALPADLTVTFAGPKRGHFFFPGAAACGELVVADIGIDPALTADLPLSVATPQTMRALQPGRPIDGHKGIFGTAIVAAGSADYLGAPLLAGRAAYRAGCGLVALAVPQAVRPIAASQLPEATYPMLPDRDTLSAETLPALRPLLQRAAALLVGPGLGPADAFVWRLLAEETLPPLVIDADGLNILARRDGWWEKLPANSILTPHPGEMARLTGDSAEGVNRIDLALTHAARWQQIVVLKGAFTIIATPEGRATVIPIASPLLASAGTGDVLAGVITGLLAQGLTPEAAAMFGAYLHACAALTLRPTLGDGGLLAHELADAVACVRL